MMSIKFDTFLGALIATVIIASALPARGNAAHWATIISELAVALLFFLHGAKLSTQAIFAGMRAWPIHLTVVLATFVMMPIYGVIARSIADIWLNPAIGSGIVVLCIMPSTVQSSVAFTSLGGGNVPAAVASASASSILGVVLTPALATWLLAKTGSAISWDGVLTILSQLILPFALGHMMRPRLIGFLERHRTLLTKVDRGAILTVVYSAFSAAVVQGLWQRYSVSDLGWTSAIDAVVLAMALATTTIVARVFGFNKSDEVAIVFCGSKKSLVSGVPIASAIFPSAQVGPLILPLMIFHQLQLMACAVLARRYANVQAAASHVSTIDNAASDTP